MSKSIYIRYYIHLALALAALEVIQEARPVLLEATEGEVGAYAQRVARDNLRCEGVSLILGRRMCVCRVRAMFH